MLKRSLLLWKQHYNKSSGAKKLYIENIVNIPIPWSVMELVQFMQNTPKFL
jgi:hypothetical protein